MNSFDAYKMDGLGNDFIIFDARKHPIFLTKEKIIEISDRKNIGCDQIILISNDKNSDATLTFFNSDGGEISACGNGSRCVAYLLMKEKKITKLSLKTKAGTLNAEMNKDNSVKVCIGKPNFYWDKIPLCKEMDNKNLKLKIQSTNDKIFEGGFALNVGNPHVIFFLTEFKEYDIKKTGPQIENHNYFPKKCNVTFANVINKKHIKVKVWERGAGLTQACGTAACATAVASSVLNLTERNVDVEFSKGVLNILWDANDDIWMTGVVSDIKKIIVKL